MNIGPGIFLVTLGAVLAFAVNYPTDNVDVSVVGWIFMIAGAVMLRLHFVEFVTRRRTPKPAAVETAPGDAATAEPGPGAAAPVATAPVATVPVATVPVATVPVATVPVATVPVTGAVPGASPATGQPGAQGPTA